MGKREKILILFFLLVWLHHFESPALNSCTAFILKTGKRIVLAKNLDWPVGDGLVVVNKRGIARESLSTGNSEPVKWKSRYGSISFNQFGKGFPLGGLNEAGLVIEELSYPMSRYPPPEGPCIGEMQWIQYHLDLSASTGEVIESLEKIIVSPFLARLHYLICDCSGKVAIVEFIDGGVKVYSENTLRVPLLTNNSYENSLEYLKYHRGFGGSRMVSPGSESPERFVRAATLLKKHQCSSDGSEIEIAFEILASVKQHDTQWSIVYDIKAGEIQFKTLGETAIQRISFNEFNFDDADKFRYMKGKNTDSLVFEKLTFEKNRRYLARLFQSYVKAGEFSKEQAGEILAQLIEYSRIYTRGEVEI